MAYQRDNRFTVSSSLSPTFLSACAKLRANDPSVLPKRNNSFKIRRGLSETEHIVIAKALTHSTAGTSLRLDLHVLNYSGKAAEAMAECIRSSINLHRVYLYLNWNGRSKSQRALQMVFSILLRALLDSTSVEETRLNLECWNIGHELAVCEDLTSLLSLPPILYGNRCPNRKTLSIKLVIDDLTGRLPLLKSNNSNITELILDGSIRSSPLGNSVPMSGCRLYCEHKYDKTNSPNWNCGEFL
jgi:hypothetical protein